MKHLKTTTIPKTQDKIILNQTDLFNYIEPDYKNFKLTEVSPKTKKIKVDVLELDKNSTFQEIFTDPEKMCLTQAQIIKFVEINKDDFINSYFFLFKNKDDFFVSSICDYSNKLSVYFYQFEFDYVWLAWTQHRFVMPQLSPNPLETKLDSLTVCPYCQNKIKLEKI